MVAAEERRIADRKAAEAEKVEKAAKAKKEQAESVKEQATEKA